MAKPEVSRDQKLFEIMCYMLILKSESFDRLRLTVTELYKKDHQFAPPQAYQTS